MSKFGDFPLSINAYNISGKFVFTIDSILVNETAISQYNGNIVDNITENIFIMGDGY